MMISSILLLLLGFFSLIQGANLLVEGASNIARSLRIPNIIIGLTIVALGTSAPEMAISITSSLNGNNGVLLGNVIGSNVFNLLMVLGVTGMVKPYKKVRETVKNDYCFMILIGAIILVLGNDSFFSHSDTNILSRFDGIILIVFLLIYFYFLIKKSFNNTSVERIKRKIKFMDIIHFVSGLTLLIIGGDWVVDNASKIASMMNISDGIIGLTIVAMGTSLPEFITGIVAINKSEEEIALGNVIGSNIINIIFILGISALIKPINIPMYLYKDMFFMFMIFLGSYYLIFIKRKFSKFDGLLMIMIYITYMIMSFV